MSCYLKMIEKIILLVFCGFLLSGVAYCVPGEIEAYQQLVTASKKGFNNDAEINQILGLIDKFTEKYSGSSHYDDLRLLRAVLLHKQNKFAESNVTITQLLKEHPAPLIEKDTLASFPILAPWLTLDVLTYINSLRGENFINLKDFVQAGVNYEAAINHIIRESRIKNSMKDQLFSMYCGLIGIYMKEKSIVKAKKRIKEYINDKSLDDEKNKEKMRAILAKMQGSINSTRDPFATPYKDMVETAPQVISAASNNVIPKNYNNRNILYVRGIIEDYEKTVMFQCDNESYEKRQGEYIKGYKVVMIKNNQVLLSKNTGKIISIKIGEGKSL